MTRTFLKAGVAALLLAGAAQAQTKPPATTPPAAPSEGAKPAPNAITPPDGVARGVIRPTRPIDPEMVTRPPAQADHPMPVITPPGTAR